MKTIPPFKLVLEPVGDDARAMQGFKWAPENIGKRHRIGGVPEFLQQSKWPTCSVCQRDMTFYAQLDSIGDDLVIADCGMVYVFICFDCCETASIIQSG